MGLLIIGGVVVVAVVVIAAQARKPSNSATEFTPDVHLSVKLARRRVEQVCRRSEHAQTRQFETLRESVEIGLKGLSEGLEKQILWVALVAPFIGSKRVLLEEMIDDLIKEHLPDEAKISSALGPTEEIDIEVEDKVIDALAKVQASLRNATIETAAVPTADERTTPMIDDLEGGVSGAGVYEAIRRTTMDKALEVAAATVEAHFPGGMPTPVAKAAFSLLMGIELDAVQGRGVAQAAEKVRRIFYDRQPLMGLRSTVDEANKETLSEAFENLQASAVQARINARNHWMDAIKRWERQTLRNLG